MGSENRAIMKNSYSVWLPNPALLKFYSLKWWSPHHDWPTTINYHQLGLLKGVVEKGKKIQMGNNWQRWHSDAHAIHWWQLDKTKWDDIFSLLENLYIYFWSYASCGLTYTWYTPIIISSWTFFSFLILDVTPFIFNFFS